MIDACDTCLRRSRAQFDLPATREPIDVDAVCVHSEAYPGRLRELARPPVVIYSTRIEWVPGDEERVAAVIGSRRPSEYGRTVAYGLGRGLGAAGVPVVSGLALGIDAIAHRGCLDGGGRTIAVLACGVDVAYPRTNRRLYERIREHGTIVSELPPGTRPQRWLFPARNRIMAALGSLTVVVEAAERSGTLITADYAADIGRDVAAVPGPVTTDVAAGTNGLLRSGAALVTGPQDVLDLLYGVGVREVPRAPTLDPSDRQLVELVSRGTDLDQIGRAAGLDAPALRAALARLERRGALRRAPSGSYVAASGF